MIPFLGYCLWVYLKQRLRRIAGSLTPARVIESLSKIMMVEVKFGLRNGGHICLPRITGRASPEVPHDLLSRFAAVTNLPTPSRILTRILPPSAALKGYVKKPARRCIR